MSNELNLLLEQSQPPSMHGEDCDRTGRDQDLSLLRELLPLLLSMIIGMAITVIIVQ